MSIAQLIEAVKAISKMEDIRPLAHKFGLQEVDRPGAKDQILGMYSGVVAGKAVVITHRWYDRCRPFLIQPDGNKVALQVDGVMVAEGSFLDDD